MIVPELKRVKSTASRFGILALLLLVGYFGSAFVILDFSEVAYPNDEEEFGQRQVAFGPRPRLSFCRPAYFDIPGGASYDGSEWALVLYRPICQFWIGRRGFAAPGRWR